MHPLDPVDRRGIRWIRLPTSFQSDTRLERKDILELYRLVDWLMRLPMALEQEYKRQLREYGTQRLMPYITSIERMGREEGRLQTLREDILDVLEARFGPLPSALRQRMSAVEDVSRLKSWLRQAVTCRSLSEFERAD